MEIYPLRIYLSEAMYKMMWEYFFPEEDDSQRRQVSCKSQFGLASTGFCLTSNAMGANQRSLLVRSPFLPSICLKSDGFWNELLKGDLLRFLPDVLWSQAETRGTQTNLSYILISTFFGEKRKFGEFQHRPVLEEQEGSLLVSMLLLLAAILSEIMSFLGNQQQLYLRQQMSQVGKVYSAITHRWVKWNICTICSLHMHIPLGINKVIVLVEGWGLGGGGGEGNVIIHKLTWSQ